MYKGAWKKRKEVNHWSTFNNLRAVALKKGIVYALDMSNDHYKGKDAIEHVAELQARGIIDSVEIHGHETPGPISAATDAARDTAVLLTSLWLFLRHFELSLHSMFIFLGIIAFSWLLWKTGRSAWIGWSRLERLHRILAQEKWEIEHNRDQERDELTALYAAKGLSGKLLTDVIEVMMADGDRLLRVMVEDELGLTLQTTEHPLKQGLGAALGCISATLLIFTSLFIYPLWGIFIGAALTIGIAAAIAAQQSQNRITNAVVWNVGLGILSVGTAYFLLDFFFQKG